MLRVGMLSPEDASPFCDIVSKMLDGNEMAFAMDSIIDMKSNRNRKKLQAFLSCAEDTAIKEINAIRMQKQKSPHQKDLMGRITAEISSISDPLARIIIMCEVSNIARDYYQSSDLVNIYAALLNRPFISLLEKISGKYQEEKGFEYAVGMLGIFVSDYYDFSKFKKTKLIMLNKAFDNPWFNDMLCSSILSCNEGIVNVSTDSAYGQGYPEFFLWFMSVCGAAEEKITHVSNGIKEIISSKINKGHFFRLIARCGSLKNLERKSIFNLILTERGRNFLPYLSMIIDESAIPVLPLISKKIEDPNQKIENILLGLMEFHLNKKVVGMNVVKAFSGSERAKRSVSKKLRMLGIESTDLNENEILGIIGKNCRNIRYNMPSSGYVTNIYKMERPLDGLSVKIYFKYKRSAMGGEVNHREAELCNYVFTASANIADYCMDLNLGNTPKKLRIYIDIKKPNEDKGIAAFVSWNSSSDIHMLKEYKSDKVMPHEFFHLFQHANNEWIDPNMGELSADFFMIAFNSRLIGDQERRKANILKYLLNPDLVERVDSWDQHFIHYCLNRETPIEIYKKIASLKSEAEIERILSKMILPKDLIERKIKAIAEIGKKAEAATDMPENSRKQGKASPKIKANRSDNFIDRTILLSTYQMGFDISSLAFIASGLDEKKTFDILSSSNSRRGLISKISCAMAVKSDDERKKEKLELCSIMKEVYRQRYQMIKPKKAPILYQ